MLFHYLTKRKLKTLPEASAAVPDIYHYAFKTDIDKNE